MTTENNNQDGAASDKDGEEGKEGETVSVKKNDYDKLNETLGSLKRELKDLRKENEEFKKPKETSQNHQQNDAVIQRLERLSLQQAGLTHKDDVELARTTAKKWGMNLEDVLGDDDFKGKLERQRTTRGNAEAVENIKGGGKGESQTKNTPAYWIAKDAPPTPEEVPDRGSRQKIIREMMKRGGTGKQFYND